MALHKPRTASNWLFFLLISTDALLIAAFILQGFGLIVDEGLQLTRDRSYGEVFQYIKQFWLVLLLAALAWQRSWQFCGVFAALFLFFLVDDYAALHENMGAALAQSFDQPTWLSIETYHIGELLVFVVYAIVSLALVIACFPRPGVGRRLARDLIVLLALMAFFGVGIDAVRAIPWPELVGDAIGALEDGGEMIVMSLIVWRVFSETLQTSADSANEAES